MLTTLMILHQTPEDLRETVLSWKREGCTVGFVPTMGFLHQGHLSLVRRIRAESDKVVASIFVNPLQFNDKSDFDKYPVDFDRDRALLESQGVDLLFIPSVSQMYPASHQTRVNVSALSAELEGAFRPGHFEGVVTVVTMLFNMVSPDIAIFGEKDFQQLRIIEQMVSDLALPIKIIRGELIREDDGLAMSSRNVRLSTQARTEALCLYKALSIVKELYQKGEQTSRVLCRAAELIVEEASLAKLEYVVIVDERDLKSVATLRPGGHYRALIAAFIDQVRLIDTISLSA